MANIPSSALKNYVQGDIMNASDYDKDREIIQVAVNDNYTKIQAQQTKTTNLTTDGSDYKGTWVGLKPDDLGGSAVASYNVSWTAIDGQFVFSIPTGKPAFSVGTNTTSLIIGGVAQPPDAYTEDPLGKMIITSEPVDAGTIVELKYLLNIPVTGANIKSLIGFEDEVDNKRFPLVSIMNYGAVADYDQSANTGTDNGPFIQAALNDMDSNGGGYVLIPSDTFVVKTPFNIPTNCRLIGTRIGMNQGPGTDTDQGPYRIRLNGSESLLIMLPDDTTQTLITMDRNAYLGGMGIVYPNQDPTFTSESSIIQYAETISASNGAQIENIRVWGAYDFISAIGEAILIRNIYGYTCGKAISLSGSDDVSIIENIHLNPNVARPVQGFIDLAQARANSVAIYLNDCDGVQIQNVHTYGYRTAIKTVGTTGSNQCTFTLDSFFFDATGLAFDIDSDSFWGVKASNGTVVMGLSNDPSFAGLLRLNKSMGSNAAIVPILLSNITVSKHASAPAVPSYVINFIYQYSFDVRLYNVSTDGSTPLISTHQSYVEGVIRSGNGQVDLAKLWQNKNWVANKDLTVDSNTDGVPDNWTVNVGAGTTLTVSRDSANGFMKVATDTGADSAHGIYQRIDLGASEKVSIMVKARVSNSRALLYVNAYDSGYANPLAMSTNFDANGFARVTFSSTSKQIYDIYISPGSSADDSVTIEYVQLTNGTRAYIAS